MKHIHLTSDLKAVSVCALLAFGGSAMAAWDLVSGCTSTSSYLGQSASCSGAAAGATIYGYSNGAGSSVSPTAFNAAANFVATNVSIYNYGTGYGLGVVAANETNVSGPHAIDNGNGVDVLMVNFTGGATSMTDLTIGWNGTDNPKTSDNNGTTTGGGSSITYNDSDLSIFAWIGQGLPTLTAMAPSTLGAANSGWSLVGNYSNVGASNGTAAGGAQSISSSIYSSYWLISAYSSSYGGVDTNAVTGETTSRLSNSNDAFKVLTIAGNTCSGTVTNGACGGSTANGVPEPGSFALMGVALMGIVASRRNKRKVA